MKSSSKLLITLFVGVLMGALDISIVGPALPSIEKTIIVPEHEIGWIFSIYILFNLVGVSLFARLSDLFGRRLLYTIAVSIFAIGSLWVALSHSFTLIIIGRAIQGFGASGIFPVASAVIGDKFPLEQRGKYLGLIGMVFGIAFILGPAVAGLILMVTDWNALFYLNIPIAGFLIYMSQKHLPSEPISGVFKVDWKGILLLGIFLSSFTLAINTIEPKNILVSLSTGRTIALFSLSVISGILLLWTEYKEPQPIINIRYFKRRQIFIASLLAVGTGFFQAVFSYLPKLAVETLKVTPAKASFLLLPAVFATAIGAPIFGRMLDKFGARLIIAIGMGLMSVGLFLAAALVQTSLVFYVAGIFVGLSFSILSGSALRYLVLNELPASDRASGQGLVTIFMSVGTMVNAIVLGGIVTKGHILSNGYWNAFVYLLVIALALFATSFFLKGKEAR